MGADAEFTPRFTLFTDGGGFQFYHVDRRGVRVTDDAYLEAAVSLGAIGYVVAALIVAYVVIVGFLRIAAWLVDCDVDGDWDDDDAARQRRRGHPAQAYATASPSPGTSPRYAVGDIKDVLDTGPYSGGFVRGVRLAAVAIATALLAASLLHLVYGLAISAHVGAGSDTLVNSANAVSRDVHGLLEGGVAYVSGAEAEALAAMRATLVADLETRLKPVVRGNADSAADTFLGYAQAIGYVVSIAASAASAFVAIVGAGTVLGLSQGSGGACGALALGAAWGAAVMAATAGGGLAVGGGILRDVCDAASGYAARQPTQQWRLPHDAVFAEDIFPCLDGGRLLPSRAGGAEADGVTAQAVAMTAALREAANVAAAATFAGCAPYREEAWGGSGGAGRGCLEGDGTGLTDADAALHAVACALFASGALVTPHAAWVEVPECLGAGAANGTEAGRWSDVARGAATCATTTAALERMAGAGGGRCRDVARMADVYAILGAAGCFLGLALSLCMVMLRAVLAEAKAHPTPPESGGWTGEAGTPGIAEGVPASLVYSNGGAPAGFLPPPDVLFPAADDAAASAPVLYEAALDAGVFSLAPGGPRRHMDTAIKLPSPPLNGGGGYHNGSDRM